MFCSQATIRAYKIKVIDFRGQSVVTMRMDDGVDMHRSASFEP
jgi:hypothetical protein